MANGNVKRRTFVILMGAVVILLFGGSYLLLGLGHINSDEFTVAIGFIAIVFAIALIAFARKNISKLVRGK